MTPEARRQLPDDVVQLHAVALHLSTQAGAESDAQASAVPEWIHLSPAGEAVEGVEGFLVKGRDGREFAISDPAAVIASTELPMSLDIDHLSMLAGWVPGATTEAYGWVEELAYVAPDGVAESGRDAPGFWGRVEWTDTGRALVESKRFRMLSPVIQMTQDEPADERGPWPPPRALGFVNVALTNLPNLRMVSLNTRGAHTTAPPSATETHMDPTEILDALRPMLGLAEDASSEDVITALAEALGVEVTLGAASEDPPPAEGDGDMANARAELAAAMSQLEALRAEVSTFRTEAAERAVEDAISEGRAQAAHRETLVGLFQRDRESFDRLTAGPAVTPHTAPVTAPGAGGRRPPRPAGHKRSRAEIDAAVAALDGRAAVMFTNYTRGYGWDPNRALDAIEAGA